MPAETPLEILHLPDCLRTLFTDKVRKQFRELLKSERRIFSRGL